MVGFYDFSPIKKSFTSARNVLIALCTSPDDDKVAGALALFLAFRKAGRESSIVCQDGMTVGLSLLVGVDQIKRKVAAKNLLVSFDYIEDSIEKVSYNIEGGKFNLVVQPKEGANPLPSDKVGFSYSGGQADLIFVVGSSSLGSLGQIYEKNKELFDKEKIVNLDNSVNNTRFGKVNLVNTGASGCSEIVGKILSTLKMPVDIDITSNLFFGLQKATGNFSSPQVGADTFEVAAFCLRAGAKKVADSVSLPPESVSRPQPGPAPDWFGPKIYKGSSRV